MCDPITAIGIGVQAGGAIFGGMSANRRAKENAAMLQRQAALRQEKARVDIEQADIRARRDAGRRDTIIGTSGISAGSFSDVIADDLATASLDKRLIQYGADIDSQNLRFQAAQQKRAGKDALIGSVFSAVGTAAAGYGNYQYRQSIKGVSSSSPWASYTTDANGALV